MALAPMVFRTLLPDAGTAELDELLDGLKLFKLAGEERPYVAVNFVSSTDGRSTFGGRSGVLGDDGDSAMFHGLRERADAVLAGTSTMATERYGRMLGKSERRERREERGQPPEPLACLITRSGNIDTTIPLFAEPEARVLIFSASEIDLAAVAAQAEVVRIDPGELTTTTVLRALRRDFGVRSVLCEGGPTLFGAMLREGVVDELFLTLSPKLSGGGTGPAITSGPELSEPRELEPAWLLERNGFLFFRYRLKASDGAADSS